MNATIAAVRVGKHELTSGQWRAANRGARKLDRSGIEGSYLVCHPEGGKKYYTLSYHKRHGYKLYTWRYTRQEEIDAETYESLHAALEAVVEIAPLSEWQGEIG